MSANILIFQILLSKLKKKPHTKTQVFTFVIHAFFPPLLKEITAKGTLNSNPKR